MENTGTFCCRSSPFSSFCLQLPPPPALSKKCTGGCTTHQSLCRHSKLYQEARHWPSGSRPARPAGYCMPQTPLSLRKLRLQLLPLAQAACDYLKPQTFIYEKREPDIRLIDCHLLKYQLVGWKEQGDPLSMGNGVIFRFVSLFTLLSN